ncbi:MAG: hypothetical protein L0Y73_03195, partial [Candidatus Aminicenantes bacterium]|nr:hypothetical protein [Candidatus Aminicenantes bacterium]
MKYIRTILIIAVLLWGYGCKTETAASNPVKFQGLQVKEVEITGSMIEGFPLGAEFDRDEIYVKSALHSNRNFLISIIDLKSGAIKKKVELPGGDYQSPTEYFSPVQIEFIGSRYYVVDQFEKIVVYDADFNHLYSAMYHQLRFFIDLFRHRDQVFFLIATKEIYKTVKSRTYLYRLKENQKPIKEMQLSGDLEFPGEYEKNIGHLYHVGYFWPSVQGFEKDGVLYYGCGNSREIYTYNLDEKKETVYSLSYLAPKKYSNTDAEKLGYYNTNGWEEKFFKESGDKVIYISYPEEMYHFGIFDIGAHKIGIAADVNLDNMTFRMDVIDTNLWEYKESFWFPIDYSIKRMLSSQFRGLVKGYFNLDKGVYIYQDLTGED